MSYVFKTYAEVSHAMHFLLGQGCGRESRMGSSTTRVGAALDRRILRFGAPGSDRGGSRTRIDDPITRIVGPSTPPAVPPPLGATAADRPGRPPDTSDGGEALRGAGGGDAPGAMAVARGAAAGSVGAGVVTLA